jgi:DNA-binding response OmpR family regulator
MRILIIEDEPSLGNVLKANFEAEAYAVDIERDGDRGLYKAQTTDYDAIVLDDILPGKHGREICRELRSRGRTLPILFMSVQGEVEKRVDVLNDGADDYITKPFLFAELSARLRALLRRPPTLQRGELRFHDLVLDESRSVAIRDGREIYLTTTEFSLLHYFMRNANHIVSRAMIMEHVWSGEADQFSHMIETHIYNLRRKINMPNLPKLIHAVSGRGYMLRELAEA